LSCSAGHDQVCPMLWRPVRLAWCWYWAMGKPRAWAISWPAIRQREHSIRRSVPAAWSISAASHPCGRSGSVGARSLSRVSTESMSRAR
jgi:hypothetical protein